MTQAARRVTMHDIARHCGVGVSTVQRALTGTGRVAAETVEQIRRTAEELGYDPVAQSAARRLVAIRHGKRPLNRVIGLYFPPNFLDTAYPYHLRMLKGITEVLAAEQYDLLVNYTFYLSDEPSYGLLRGEYDALISAASEASIKRMVENLRTRTTFADVPILSLLEPLAGCSAVVTDEQQGGYLAAAHLLDLGHRHVTYFAPEGQPDSSYHRQRRYLGYCRAYEERGLDYRQLLHPFGAGVNGGDMRQIARAALALLRERQQITGVLAPNDDAAAVMIDLLPAHGFRIPQDISLVGFDDALGEVNGIALTSITVPLEEIGRHAARLVIAQINEADIAPQTLTLPVHLVARTSTAPPRT
jgi:LacI family transcriptional regulator